MEYLGKEHLNDNKKKNKTTKYIMKMKLHYIDAENFGNNSRFINHSCQPNAEFVKREVDGVKRCEVYALEDINSGKEITCNYGYEKERDPEGMVKCNCSTECSFFFNFGEFVKII